MRVCRLLVDVGDDLAVRNGCPNMQIWDRDSIFICEGDVSMTAVRMIEKLQQCVLAVCPDSKNIIDEATVKE